MGLDENLERSQLFKSAVKIHENTPTLFDGLNAPQEKQPSRFARCRNFTGWATRGVGKGGLWAGKKILEGGFRFTVGTAKLGYKGTKAALQTGSYVIGKTYNMATGQPQTKNAEPINTNHTVVPSEIKKLDETVTGKISSFIGSSWLGKKISENKKIQEAKAKAIDLYNGSKKVVLVTRDVFAGIGSGAVVGAISPLPCGTYIGGAVGGYLAYKASMAMRK